jgi:hypothetical protein
MSMARAKKALALSAGLLIALLLVHVYLLDGLHGSILRLLDRSEDTVFAGGYSDSAFRWLREGSTQQHAQSALGLPLAEVWSYRRPDGSRTVFRLEDGRITRVLPREDPLHPEPRVGESAEQLTAQLGEPDEEIWLYSQSPGDNSYRERSLLFQGDVLIEKRHSFYVD